MTYLTDTAAAQRRLLEALSLLRLVPDGTEALLSGFPAAIQMAEAHGVPELARVFVALGELVEAVDDDHAEVPR